MRVGMIVMMAGILSATACGNGNDNESPRVAIAAGVYDTTVVRDGASIEGIGLVSTERDEAAVFLKLGNDSTVRFAGRVSEDGHMSGDGSFTVTDILFQSRGEATFSESGGVHTVAGSVVAMGTPVGGFEREITFTMQRPADADASGFSGTYRFTLAPSPSACACTSTIDLSFTIDASGSGLADAATEHRSDGSMIGTLAGAGIFLSPQGKVGMTGSYQSATVPGPALLELIGSTSGSNTLAGASGDTFFGFTPANRIGTWSAERVE